MVDHKAALAALSQMEEAFARVEEGESESVPIDARKPAIHVRRPPQFVYVHLPDPGKLDAARSALRDLGEWIDTALAGIPVERHASLRAGCHEALAEVGRLLADHEAMALRGVETPEDIEALRRLVKGELARRMFDLRDCVERLNRARSEPAAVTPEKTGPEAARLANATSTSEACASAESQESTRAPEAALPKRPEDLKPDDTLTAAEVMDLFGVPRTTLQYWQESKGLEYAKHPATGRNLYRWGDIKQFVQGRQSDAC